MRPEHFLGISQETRAFLGKLLTKEAKLRPSAEELMRDEWLNAYRTKADSPVLKKADILFRSIKGECKFRQAALYYITWHLTPTESTEQLTRLFIALDADRDGRLGIEDLKNGLADPEDAQDLLQALASDYSGFIQYHEFLQATLNWQEVLSAAVLRSAFQAFDRNSNGRIDTTEVRLMLQGEQEVATPVWEDVLQDADKDGNGVVDYEEFRQLMVGD